MVRKMHTIELSAQSAVENRLLLFLAGLKRPIEPVHIYRPLADFFKLSVLQ